MRLLAMQKSSALTGVIMAAVALVLLLPVISVGLALFNSAPWSSISSNYLGNTLLLMAMVGALTALIGVSCAWLVTIYDFPGRRWLSWVLVLPIAIPAYINAYTYADLLEFYGPVQSFIRSSFGYEYQDYWFPSIRNLPGATITLSLVLYPYVYLLSRAAFLNQSQSQWWAARSLGASSSAAFFKIALPSARPAIAGGVALVLMETLADFGVADFFSVQTFSVGIFRNWLILGNKGAALKLAALMLMFVFILVLFETATRKGQTASHGRNAAQTERSQLTGLGRWVTCLVCFIPVLLGLLIPVTRLLYHVVSKGDSFTSANLGGYLSNSVSLAVIVGLVVMALALLLTWVKHNYPTKLNLTWMRLATLGYALPGALLAVGLLAPLSVLDQGLTQNLKTVFGWDGGLILTGTIIALVYALVIRFLTIAYNGLEAGFSNIPRSMDHAARSLNATRGRRMRRIFLPLLRPSLISVFILVFIDVMRELPATLIMRPFNFDTLATRVYWLASDERLPEASTAALTIIGIGLVSTSILNVFLVKRRFNP